MRPVLQWFSRSLGSTTLDAVDVQVRRARLPFLMVASLIAALFLAPGSNARERHETSWVATWAASPQRAGAPVIFNRQTVRQILHVSLGGHRLRVRLSNAYGDQPLVIGSARVALPGGGAAIVNTLPAEVTGSSTSGMFWISGERHSQRGEKFAGFNVTGTYPV